VVELNVLAVGAGLGEYKVDALLAVVDLGALHLVGLQQAETLLGGDLAEPGAAEDAEPDRDDEHGGGDVEEGPTKKALEIHVRTGSRARHLSGVKGTGRCLDALPLFAGGLTRGTCRLRRPKAVSKPRSPT